MSKMADLDIEIREMLERDTNPVVIAKMLDIPITWVYDTLERMDDPDEELYHPNNTVNS